MISSDMEEVIGVSDRIAVMHEGAIAGILERQDFSRAQGAAAGGRQRDSAAEGRMQKKDLGLLVLILVVGAVVGVHQPAVPSPINIANTANLVGLFGMFAIGQGFVIITGGIELSVGSVIALLGVLFVDLIANYGVPWPLALVLMLALGVLIGLVHGLLITRLEAAALHRHALRPADLPRHRPLLHRRRHRRLRVRRRAFPTSNG